LEDPAADGGKWAREEVQVHHLAAQHVDRSVFTIDHDSGPQRRRLDHDRVVAL
jgi:hypothetical protein